MCRLFGMCSGKVPSHVTYWLLNAPDSLEVQAHECRDGCGIGWFTSAGKAEVEKSALAAYADTQFAARARELDTTTCVAHVRWATTGAAKSVNAHPFVIDNRIFAHNGTINSLDRLEAELGAQALSWVQGDTDSERYFALITKHIHAAHGDVHAGIVSAVKWLVANTDFVSLNFILATANELFALRYPAARTLYFLQETPAANAQTRVSTLSSGMRVESAQPHPVVLVASEPLDQEGWIQLQPGELLHVDTQARVRREQLLTC